MHVFNRYAQLHRHKRAHARRVEHAGHAHHAILREAADLIGRLSHGIERVGHHDEDGIGRILGHLLDHALDDVVVGAEQVVTAHPGLAREAGSDDDDIAVGRFAVVASVGGDADHPRIGPQDRAGLEHIEPLASRHSLEDVGQDHIGELRIRDALRRGRTDEPATYYRYLFAIQRAPFVALDFIPWYSMY